jgi:hypothetical protein
MKIAVCLLTCGREAYTRKTLETFTAHNGGDPRFLLLHADDASETTENRQLAEAHGFTTVVQSTQRRGWKIVRLRLFEQAAKDAAWILFLENDIESLRPFPWALFDAVRRDDADISCLRLYGRFKDSAKTDKCLETHKRRGHIPVRWRPWRDAPEPSQVGTIHWSSQPSVTRAQELISLHRRGTEPSGLTVRVKKNVMAHFGVERTLEDRHAAREAAPC